MRRLLIPALLLLAACGAPGAPEPVAGLADLPQGTTIGVTGDEG